MGSTKVRGLDVRVNEMNFTAVRLHYSADPAKGAEWYDQMRALFADPNAWESEFEINWFITAGTRVFPEFQESLHCKSVELRRRKVIYRAWDFGWHAPVCVIGQIDEKDRLVLMHEVVGKEQTTREFAQQVIDRCAEWFPTHSPGFQDFCDPAGQQAQPAASERSEVRDIEVLQTFGIHPSWENGWSRKDGRSLIHQLLRARTDGTPGLYVDGQGCPTLLQGFLGKYVFPEFKDGRARDEPDEGLHPWADSMAALRYMCTGLYSALGLRRFHYQPVIPTSKVTTHGYGTPLRKQSESSPSAR